MTRDSDGLPKGTFAPTRLITVGGLYLLAIMVIAAYLPPLRELYFLLLSYTTLLFTYFEGRTGGLFFPHKTYHLTVAVSLAVIGDGGKCVSGVWDDLSDCIEVCGIPFSAVGSKVDPTVKTIF